MLATFGSLAPTKDSYLLALAHLSVREALITIVRLKHFQRFPNSLRNVSAVTKQFKQLFQTLQTFKAIV
jgi:hypothetical protein